MKGIDCPFCKKPIPEQEYPLAHMTHCMQEEAKKMDAFFRNVSTRIQVGDHEI